MFKRQSVLWLFLFQQSPSFDLPPQWSQRPEGKQHDTVKPLVLNGFDLRSTILVDNEACKAAPGEEGSLLLLPSWEACSGKRAGGSLIPERGGWGGRPPDLRGACAS